MRLISHSLIGDNRARRLFTGGLLQALSLLFYLAHSTAASANQGAEMLFRQCASCHVLDANGPARIGPTLAGIVGRAAADVSGYQYSEALVKKKEEGLVWDLSSLDAFLASPSVYVPGTKMGFSGIPEGKQRDILLRWIADKTGVESGDMKDTTVTMDPAVEKILSLEADVDFGEYLANECVTCHQASGTAAGGVPPITGLSTTSFINALIEYKNGKRVSQVMQLMTNNLGNDEIASLALYFSTLEN